MVKSKRIDLKKLFVALDEEMKLNLRSKIDEVRHPVAKGCESELNWIGLLRDYLPERYTVDSGFVIDSNGRISEQIDLIVYDRNFTPFIFKGRRTIFIPAEGVYAVFEIKSTLTGMNCKYAQKKIESVRNLKRTSVSFSHIKGTDKKEIFPITSGILTNSSKYRNPTSKTFADFKSIDFIVSLDFGIVNQGEVFNVTPILSRFLLMLIEELRTKGSVPALDVKAYLK